MFLIKNKTYLNSDNMFIIAFASLKCTPYYLKYDNNFILVNSFID